MAAHAKYPGAVPQSGIVLECVLVRSTRPVPRTRRDCHPREAGNPEKDSEIGMALFGSNHPFHSLPPLSRLLKNACRIGCGNMSPAGRRRAKPRPHTRCGASYRLAGRARAQSSNGARHRHRTILRNAAQEIEYDDVHGHEQPEIHITIRYF
jgi:hypothetical protein